MMKTTRALGRRLTPRQAAIHLAQQAKTHIPAKRFAARVSNITDWETTGIIYCVGPVSPYAFRVIARTTVLLEVNDYIWVREHQGVQGVFTFDGFVKGGAA